MERKRHSPASITIFTLLVGVLSQNLVIPVTCSTTPIEDQKNNNSPRPHTGGPPTDLSNSLCNSLTEQYFLFHYLCKIYKDIVNGLFNLIATVGHLHSNLKYE